MRCESKTRLDVKSILFTPKASVDVHLLMECSDCSAACYNAYRHQPFLKWSGDMIIILSFCEVSTYVFCVLTSMIDPERAHYERTQVTSSALGCHGSHPEVSGHIERHIELCWYKPENTEGQNKLESVPEEAEINIPSVVCHLAIGRPPHISTCIVAMHGSRSQRVLTHLGRNKMMAIL